MWKGGGGGGGEGGGGKQSSFPPPMRLAVSFTLQNVARCFMHAVQFLNTLIPLVATIITFGSNINKRLTGIKVATECRVHDITHDSHYTYSL